MTKRLLILLLVCFGAVPAFAGHIAGGEMYYTYVGAGEGTNVNRYQITLRLFRECNPVGQAAPLPDMVRIGVFKNTTMVITRDIPQSTFSTIRLNSPLTCIVNKPEVCYQVASYTFTVDLAVVPETYTASYQTCCRSNSILNVQQFAIPDSPLPGEGSTYTCDIPGTNLLQNGTNSSAVFSLKDTVLVCSEKRMFLDFSATDADGDSLSYSFCAAYNRGNAKDASIVTPSAPSYTQVTYKPGYSGQNPMGDGVVIDPSTGQINGKAPAAGVYVVNVCVAEWRNGEVISLHRKDFIVRVSNCDFAAAELEPSYTVCDDFTAHFQNNSSSAGVLSYYWDFGVGGDTSSSPTPDYTYQDTGVYSVKLVINRGQGCSDSATTLLNVFPGFDPAFTKIGGCYKSPVTFTDATATRYGVVNSWRWDFGDNATGADTATGGTASYQFPAPGEYNIRLAVTNSKGCKDSVTTAITISDKPTLTMPFKDTIICRGDTLQLGAAGDLPAAFEWLPRYNQINGNTANPLVFPAVTTQYMVTADDGNGCTASDTVQVQVFDRVTLKLAKDSVICLTDEVQFHPATNALYFSWLPSNAVDSADIKEPRATPNTTTTYYLKAFISDRCFAEAAITVRPAPYPVADAGMAAAVCYGATTQLTGGMVGNTFTWSPAGSLLNAQTITPTAGPQQTTTYTLTVRDTTATGCPKPVYDTVTVRVVPPVQVFAGNDTTVVINQPLQLKASGADFYLWEPGAGMSNPASSDPTVIFNGGNDGAVVTYRVKGTTAEGCVGYDTLRVYVYKTFPEVFIPSAFTPNNDGRNDKLIPVVAGMKKLEQFAIYNRWGQQLYTTAIAGQGWDGTAGGQKQPAGSYIYLIKAVDYLDKPVIKKGSVVLIR